MIARLMIWVLYNERTNCLRMHVQACSFTNHLHGKAAKQAMLTEITVLKLKSHGVHLR